MSAVPNTEIDVTTVSQEKQEGLLNEIKECGLASVDKVYRVGGKIREDHGMDPTDWVNVDARLHLVNAHEHIQAALAHSGPDPLDAVDSEGRYPSYTPHLRNAALRVLMAIRQCERRREREDMKQMVEAHDE